MPHASWEPARCEMNGICLDRWRSLCGRDDIHRMTPSNEESSNLGGMACRPSNVGWPDTGDDEHPHGARISASVRATPRCSRRNLRSSTVHAPANAMVAARTAEAAPVAPHREPRTTIRGRSTTISTA